MPTLPEYATSCSDTLVMSLGGSTLFPPEHPELDVPFFLELKQFLTEQIRSDRTVIGVIGGGDIARRRQQAARRAGVSDQKAIDTYGIHVTRHNALFVSDLLNNTGITTKKFPMRNRITPGIVYLRGGTRPGHTTDLVAIQAAIMTGVNIVFNVSNTPGLHPYREDGSFDRSQVVPEITYRELLPHLPEHSPGLNIPIDREAAKLALHQGIIFILVGKNFDNLNKAICGAEFTGTVIRP
jgi:uridylate kinase